MKINHRSKEYPNDKNKYKKVEIKDNTITSIPLPEITAPPLLSSPFFPPHVIPPIIQQVIDENIKPWDATNTD